MSNSAISYIRDHSRATNGRRMVLLVIADSADEETWASWLGVPEIAKRAKKSVRAVQKILQQLQEGREIYIEPRYRDDGSRTSNRYTIVHDKPTRERATHLELLRKEADGTCEYMVENQRGLQLGQDWLGFANLEQKVHHPLNVATPPPERSDTTPRPDVHHTLSADSPLEPSIIPNRPLKDLKDSDAPIGTSHSQENLKPSEPIPTTTALEQPPNSAPPPKPRSEAQQARDALIDAAAWAWNLDLKKSGSMAGKWVNFCTGQIERGKGKKEPEFYTHQISADDPMTARDIIGYRVWYDANPTTAGQIFPTAPETVNRYIETYRASTLTPDMEAKIQRQYDRVVLGIQWELVCLDPLPPIEPCDEPTPEEVAARQPLNFMALVDNHRMRL